MKETITVKTTVVDLEKAIVTSGTTDKDLFNTYIVFMPEWLKE